MPASDEHDAPRLDIPAPPASPAGAAILYSWTTFFQQLINREYSAIIIHRFKQKGGFTQAINRFRTNRKIAARDRDLAMRIGIMLVCDKDGRPQHWELRFQKERNEQRNSLANPAHVAWRSRMLETLVENCEVSIQEPIEADAVQWCLYAKMYNKLSRTPKKSETTKVLRSALSKRLLTHPEHWMIVNLPDESLVLRISSELRDALRIAEA